MKMQTGSDWWSCDGKGHVAAPVARPRVSPTVSRRGVLTGAALGAVSWLARTPAIAQIAVAPKSIPGKRDVLVSIFLRGAMDGLNVVAPYAEDAYHRLRPVLALPNPNDKTTKAADRCLDLDGFFGLHPAMAPVLPLFQSGKLAFVHASGSNDQSHSHFESMDCMERGLSFDGQRTAGGWLSRCLLATPAVKPTPLRAVAIGQTNPEAAANFRATK